MITPASTFTGINLFAAANPQSPQLWGVCDLEYLPGEPVVPIPGHDNFTNRYRIKAISSAGAFFVAHKADDNVTRDSRASC
jgi:hypothetical protein